ncbi:hypothetical protein NW752_007450 [Fusarium irregulare]|uniref:Heterokaryon incompatibility domain-containing protein n=1 Tax=Fusarium irregulare TaxID=2494466 RepID=A0A9W8PLD3_9HYPO|nr:hypothetical protein NW766_007644 [Fusarium irregulare]KAJ4014679.1 hypothetical protein NW752_007450 [Fusarium irregulare]
MPLSRVNPWSSIIELEEEPLSKRAWVLQERYLATRTLHIASTQMYFECRSGFYPQNRHMRHKDSQEDFKIHRRDTAQGNAKPTDAWKDIVRRYANRSLTVESDKLTAIGGLAARVFLERGLTNSPGEEYLAGLWRKDLLWDLVWQTWTGDLKRSTPTSYTAPSWSWASINGPIAFLESQSIHRPSDIQSLALMKGAKVDLESSESPFGRVTSGWVHLSGIKIYPCDVEEDGDLWFREGDGRFRLHTDMDPSRFGLPEVHLADYMDKKSELVVVPLTLHYELVGADYKDEDPAPGAYFLILISSTSGGGLTDGLLCFRRVGVGTSYMEELRGNDNNARRRLQNRCMEAMVQGTLEDIIIV